MLNRIFTRFVAYLRWMLLIATSGGLVLVYLSWTIGERIRDLQANGVEATATIDGATRTKGRRSGEHYVLKLSWRDAKGELRTSYGVPVSNDFVRKISRDDRIIVSQLRIKYLPDGSDVTPLVLDDAAREAENDDYMLMGMGLAGGGAVGTLLMFLLRRRRSAVALGPAGRRRIGADAVSRRR